MRVLRKTVRAQSGVEYMLTVSVIVISVFAAFYLVVGDKGEGPAKTSFENVRSFPSAALASASDPNRTRTRKTGPFGEALRSTYAELNPPSISFAARFSAAF